MKYRTGFVSNSSSSSFVIDKKGLTKNQIEKIQQWIEEAYNPSDFENPKYSDKNTFNESNKHFFGIVSYHVGFFDFLSKIKVPENNIDGGN